MTTAAMEQRRQATPRKVTPAQVRKILRLAGKQSPTGRWAMSVRAIAEQVGGITGGRVQQILKAHADRARRTSAAA